MDDGSTFRVSVSRGSAAVRGLVRLTVSSLVLGGVYVALPEVDWRLMWLRERASALMLGSLGALGVLAGLAVAAAGLRWLALALWRKATFIEISPGGVRMALGPFGEYAAPWSDLSARLRDDIDPELLDYVPDTALAIELRHRRTGEDWGALMQRIGRVEPGAYNRSLRNYLKR